MTVSDYNALSDFGRRNRDEDVLETMAMDAVHIAVTKILGSFEKANVEVNVKCSFYQNLVQEADNAAQRILRAFYNNRITYHEAFGELCSLAANKEAQLELLGQALKSQGVAWA